MKYQVYDIIYDLDPEDIEVRDQLQLPTTIDIEVPDDIQAEGEDEISEYLSDEISDRTGFCHRGFKSKSLP